MELATISRKTNQNMKVFMQTYLNNQIEIKRCNLISYMIYEDTSILIIYKMYQSKCINLRKIYTKYHTAAASPAPARPGGVQDARALCPRLGAGSTAADISPHVNICIYLYDHPTGDKEIVGRGWWFSMGHLGPCTQLFTSD